MTDKVNQRVEELLSRMTVREKVAQMVQIPYTMVGREKSLEWAKLGAGSFLHVLGDDARELQEAARQSRLGIPIIFGIDAIHGHGLNQNATIFPSQLAAACSWNPELVEEMGRVTAREVATDGLHWTFSPVLCLGRDTRWGRVDETFGEDPYLAGELGAAIIKGYQGDSLDGEESILACAKHYIAYGEAVGGRDSCDTEITFRKLREVFLPPFAKAVKAGCATIMTAYGSIDGTPFTISEKAMRKILRDELGFDGFVVTDWDNVNSLVNFQHVAEDILEASKLAAVAGNDMIMTSFEFYEAAVKLVEDGRMDEKVIDEAAGNILRIKLRMGLFEKPEKKGKPGCFSCPEHLEASLKTARESIVLLKNNAMLPLGPQVRKVAVIGPSADNVRAQYGDWTYFTHPSASSHERTAIRPYTTIVEGIRELAGQQGVQVEYHQGCSILDGEYADIEGAVAVAKDCDAIVLAVGDLVEQTGERKDRANLSLSGKQGELFQALRGLQKPLATVLVSSKPLCMEVEADQSDAVIIAFNGGMFGGTAVAEAVFGTLNPSGKLPISFPRHSGQIPVYYNELTGWHGGKYVDLPAEPLYTFGEGLSYTRFSYQNLQWNQAGLTASVDVTNTGDREGFETVQAYVNDCVSSVMTPCKQLAGFAKVHLAAGETKTVQITLDQEAFTLITPQEERVVEPGAFVVMVGPSSKDDELLKVEIAL